MTNDPQLGMHGHGYVTCFTILGPHYWNVQL